MPANPVECWGCECGVPVREGMHEEDTGINGTVYVYPCNREANQRQALSEEAT
jgi:hypothetical protein